MKIDFNHLAESSIAGLHLYGIQGDHSRLVFASRNFCDLLGYSKPELEALCKADYLPLVHPEDRQEYTDCITQLRNGRDSVSLTYRLRKKNGGFQLVTETVRAEHLDDYPLCGVAVLSKCTDEQEELSRMRMLNEKLPCGILRYTCERYPRITYINDTALAFIRCANSGEADEYLNEIKENIFLMLPVEERHRFRLYLERVCAADAPLAGEMSVLRCDGSIGHVFGWVMKVTNPDGTEEFQSMCVDVTERREEKREYESSQYFRAITNVFDTIFECDRRAKTLKCVHSSSLAFRKLRDISMQYSTATENWLSEMIAEEDRSRTMSFIRRCFEESGTAAWDSMSQILYHAHSSSGEIKMYNGTFLSVTESIALYCIRRVPEEEEANFIRRSNNALRSNMQDIALHFTDGAIAFEVSPEQMVTPLYASDGTFEFFGMTKEEWMPLMETSTPLDKFVAKSKTDIAEFESLLETGEADFSYFDRRKNRKCHVKAICTSRAADQSSSKFIILYKLKSYQAESDQPSPRVSIRTFGYFDVFVGNRPIVFRNQKAKELLALLVDRRGGFISSEEAIGYLWEDDPISPVTSSRYRKVALRLKNTLDEYGISEIVEVVGGKRRIVPENIQCDYYDYLAGKEELSAQFKGSYLSNYSWAETTLAGLIGTEYSYE